MIALCPSSYPGRQHLGAIFNLVAYYVLALPVGISLAFHPRIHLGLEGLWIGMWHYRPSESWPLSDCSVLGQVLGLFVVGIGEYGAVWLGTDWDKEVQRGKERNLLEAKRQALHANESGQGLQV